MSGGLISLISFGNENVILNGNPQMTYFYTSFMRHTHFSQEPIEFPLEGPQQLQFDAPILLKTRIPRDGDLLSDLVLRVDIPDIFSKAYLDKTTDPYTLAAQPYTFQWVRQLGVRMIERVTFLVGGAKIQEFTGDWIAARALLDLDQTAYQKWRVMVGDVPELFDPANGVFAAESPASGKYPHVVEWVGQAPQQNLPSIPGRRLRVPLGLWFSDFIENSLPLVALQNHFPEIQIQLRSIRDLYTVIVPGPESDTTPVRVRYGYKVGNYLPTDQYTTVWNPDTLGPLPNTLNNYYQEEQPANATLRHFLTDVGAQIPQSDSWPLNISLEGTFTFLTDAERKVFATKTLTYPVRQVQYFDIPGVTAKARYEVDVHNVVTRAVWWARRSDAVRFRNDYVNLTNWILANQRPYALPSAAAPTYPYVPGLYASGLLIPGTQRRILRAGAFLANGTYLFNPQDSGYFTEYVPYKYLGGNSMPSENMGLAAQYEMWPIHVYSFALRGSDAKQPSGTLNASQINKLQFEYDVEAIPVGALYTYDVTLIMETMNYLDIASGMGGLKFAL